MRAARLVTQDQRIGLGAMQQTGRYASERGMKQRSLPLNQVPPAIGTLG
jgi:hypothetical protein